MSYGRQGTINAHDSLARQIPTFVVIGALGFCLDAAMTVTLVRWFALAPLIARLPSFVVVTLLNFALNRAFTFRASRLPWARALGRYVMVCLGGLGLNYAVYASALAGAPMLGVAVTPAVVTLCVACGTGAATLLTFAGFRAFAFRG